MYTKPKGKLPDFNELVVLCCELSLLHSFTARALLCHFRQVRVYTKPKGKLPDFNEPVVLHRSNASIEGFCNKIHKTMLKQLKYAHVWGSSVKHRPQKVGKDHPLHDEDIVQIVKKV
jgi:ribosome-interacting GTPase 1